jgi:hypothetical protein
MNDTTKAERQARADARYDARLHSTPLTTSQHILHLLLTVFTGGLWIPVWIWRAVEGNAPSDGGPRSGSSTHSKFQPLTDAEIEAYRARHQGPGEDKK